MNAWGFIKQAWKRWKTFDGRARRKEYWFFTLSPVLFVFVTMIIAAIVIPNLVRSRGDQHVTGVAQQAMPLPALLFFYILIACLVILYVRFIVASIAVSVRRLHDTGHSGWWVWFAAVPLIGPLYLLYLHCKDSDAGDNQYGPNPKAPAAFNPGSQSVYTG